jgi:molybdate transport system substrate-binding protein
MRVKLGLLVVFALGVVPPAAHAAEVKVLSAGAMKEVVLSAVPDFEKATGHKVAVANDTAGGLSRRILGGEAFDVAVITPAAIDDLISKGKLAAESRVNLAQVGIGVMVKAGAPKPDVSTVDAFKRALLEAKSVAYIDPASGGSSGIYLAGLFDKLGVADQIKPKAKLKQGGYVGELIVSGEAELGIHQISEIVPVKGVTLVAPLPKEIQNTTIYAAGVAANATDAEAARTFIKTLQSPGATEVLSAKGMERPGS